MVLKAKPAQSGAGLTMDSAISWEFERCIRGGWNDRLETAQK